MQKVRDAQSLSLGSIVLEVLSPRSFGDLVGEAGAGDVDKARLLVM